MSFLMKMSPCFHAAVWKNGYIIITAERRDSNQIQSARLSSFWDLNLQLSLIAETVITVSNMEDNEHDVVNLYASPLYREWHVLSAGGSAGIQMGTETWVQFRCWKGQMLSNQAAVMQISTRPVKKELMAAEEDAETEADSAFTLASNSILFCLYC